jgi:hypothetical protein
LYKLKVKIMNPYHHHHHMEVSRKDPTKNGGGGGKAQLHITYVWLIKYS